MNHKDTRKHFMVVPHDSKILSVGFVLGKLIVRPGTSISEFVEI